jgi:hypothetical protein
VLEGVSNTHSIPLTVGPNMATVPVDAGFMYDKSYCAKEDDNTYTPCR